MNKTVNCPTGSKKSWSTKRGAEQELGRIWRKGLGRGPAKLPVRSYHCSCGQWHLTSKPYDSSRRQS